MKDKIIGGIAIIALILSFVGLVGGDNQSALKVGGTTNYDSLVLSEDLTVGDDVTISGGVLSVTTAASATSTLTIGRTQTYATSSATRICLDFNTQATTTIAGTANGVVTWKYGACN